jgi:hypothetical protein
MYRFIYIALKRKIDIASIRGITVTKSTDEFVVHGNDIEYDYNFISSKRKKIVEFIAKNYFELTKRDMKLCELDLKTLKDFVTLKKEKKSNVNFSRMPATGLISLSAFVYGTIDDSIRKRSAVVLKSDSMYFKQRVIQKSLTLNDFKIQYVLGKSNISKIFMVELRETGEIFALKAIRKDAIVYLNCVQNIILEKKILLTPELPFLNTLINSFQNETHLFMVTPIYRGGDLFEFIMRNGSLDQETYK